MLYPKRVISVWLGDPAPPSPNLELHEKSTSKRGMFSNTPNTPLGACGSTWYYYQFFFASAQEREGMRRRWGDGSGGGIGGWLRFWTWGVSLCFCFLFFVLPFFQCLGFHFSLPHFLSIPPLFSRLGIYHRDTNPLSPKQVKKSSEEDGRCRLTRVITMESLLKSVFGDGWSAPSVSLPGH